MANDPHCFPSSQALESIVTKAKCQRRIHWTIMYFDFIAPGIANGKRQMLWAFSMLHAKLLMAKHANILVVSSLECSTSLTSPENIVLAPMVVVPMITWLMGQSQQRFPRHKAAFWNSISSNAVGFVDLPCFPMDFHPANRSTGGLFWLCLRSNFSCQHVINIHDVIKQWYATKRTT